MEPDVMVGFDAVRHELAHVAPDPLVLACSSAGGGLRLAVVGYEREISAEAGHRAALSAGARVHVSAGRLDDAARSRLTRRSTDLPPPALDDEVLHRYNGERPTLRKLTSRFTRLGLCPTDEAADGEMRWTS